MASVELFIVDLGEAELLDSDDEHTGRRRVGATCYRAPEVTLGALLLRSTNFAHLILHTGMPWAYGVDAFAAGCVLAELSLGSALFHLTDSDVVRLALLERVLGPFPVWMAKRVENKRPGMFTSGIPPKVIFPPASPGTGGISALDVRKVLTAAPLTVSPPVGFCWVRTYGLQCLIHDEDYRELCEWLLTLDPLRRRRLSHCLALDFLTSQEDDYVRVEPSVRRLS